MSRFYLCDFEMEALAGLRHGAFRLYVTLRSRMNYSTGEVGRKPLISRWALREALYVEGKRGRAAVDSGTPSEKEVRGYEDELLAAGLIEYRTITSQKQLIFFLPMASKNEDRAQEVGQVSSELGQTYQGQAQSHTQQGFQPELGQKLGQTKTPELGQTSGYGDTELKPKPHSIELSSSSQTVPSRESANDDDKTAGDEKIPAIPTTPRQWWQLMLNAGFTTTQAGQDKAVAMYRQWVGEHVTQADFDVAMLKAKAAVGIPASPVYLATVMQQVRSEGRGALPVAAQRSGDKPFFVANEYPVGDKAKAAPHLAELKEKLKYAH